MATLESILSQAIVQRIGWTLVHFLWQGAAVAVVAAVVLRVLRNSSANMRYVIACAALALMVVLPLVTFQLVKIAASSIAIAEPSQMPVQSQAENINMATVPLTPVMSPPSPVETRAITPRIPLKERVNLAIEASLPYVVACWLFGVFGLSLWHLGGWTQLQRLRRRMVRPVDLSLRDKLDELAELLHIRVAVEVVESALVQVPTVIGWLRPIILLPASAMTGLSGEQLEAILAHELAHIKRHDYLVNMLQTAVEILGFYHPAVWWVSNRIRMERENCCDDTAVGICGDRICYARALATMEEIRGGQFGLAVAASGGSLFERIGRLMGKRTAEKERAGWMPSIAAVFLIVTTVAIMTSCVIRPTGKETENAWSQKLNEAQQAYMQWTDKQFHSFLDRSEYIDMSKSAKKELEVKWLEMLNQPENPKYIDAINSLVAIKSQKAVTPLLRVATERVEKDNRNRWMAVRALGIVGDKSIVPQLIPLVYFPNQNTRFWAQISLVRLTGVNFGTDWQAWGKWWNEQGGKPPFEMEVVRWTSNNEWADPNVQRDADQNFVERLKDTDIFVVTFKPKMPFHPTTAKEMLDAFNKNHPSQVRTHHYRTEVVDNNLVGHICVDSKRGSGRVIEMLEKSDSLQFINSEKADEQKLDTFYKMGQPGLEETGKDLTTKATKENHSKKSEVWENNRPTNGKWGIFSLGGAGGESVAFGKPSEENGQTWLTVTYNAKDPNVRLVAIDNAGKVYAAAQTMTQGAGAFTQITCAFDMPLAKIASFQLQPTTLNQQPADNALKLSAQGSQAKADSGKAKISVEGRFYMVDSNSPSVADFLTNTLKIKKLTDVNVVVVPANKERTPFQLNDEQTKSLTRWLQSQKDARMLNAPRVVVLDGEGATISVTTDVSYIKEYKEPNQVGGKPEPVQEKVTIGTIFNVTPQLQPDTQAILLNMKYQLTNLLKMSKTPYKPGYEIELPELEQTELQTRISVPQGQSLFMPMGTVHEEINTKVKTKYLYLLVTAAVMPEKTDPNQQPASSSEQHNTVWLPITPNDLESATLYLYDFGADKIVQIHSKAALTQAKKGDMLFADLVKSDADLMVNDLPERGEYEFVLCNGAILQKQASLTFNQIKEKLAKSDISYIARDMLLEDEKSRKSEMFQFPLLRQERLGLDETSLVLTGKGLLVAIKAKAYDTKTKSLQFEYIKLGRVDLSILKSFSDPNQQAAEANSVSAGRL